MGAGADGWWNDPVAAAGRLAQAVASWSNGSEDPVTLVFDGKAEPTVAEAAGGNLEVTFATRTGRDAADDRIVDLVEQRFGGRPEITVITSDRGLAERLPPGVAVEGAGGFRGRIGLAQPSGGRGGRRRQR